MPAQIPQPTIDSDSREYWDGLAQGELRIQHCAACSKYVFYPRSICPHCFAAELTWVKAAGRGEIYSYTVVRQAFGRFSEDVPYVIAIVELDEGVRMMSRIVGTPPEDVKVGAAVQVTFEHFDEGVTLPYFQLTK